MHYVEGGHGAVRIVALDVTVPGLHHGDIDEEADAWLDGALSAEPRRPTILMMHQPPFDCGVPYLDAYHCRDGERLAYVVARHPAVERIVCGHVHRFMQLRFGGTVLCTAPIDDDGDRPSPEGRRQARLACRAAGLPAAPLAAGGRPGHTSQSDRELSRPLCVCLRDNGMHKLEIVHRTRYDYAEPVTLGDYRLMFRPRDSHDLRLVATNLVIEPAAQVRWIYDPFGNSIAIASFGEEPVQDAGALEHHPARALWRAARCADDRGLCPQAAVRLPRRGGA